MKRSQRESKQPRVETSLFLYVAAGIRQGDHVRETAPFGVVWLVIDTGRHYRTRLNWLQLASGRLKLEKGIPWKKRRADDWNKKGMKKAQGE